MSRVFSFNFLLLVLSNILILALLVAFTLIAGEQALNEGSLNYSSVTVQYPPRGEVFTRDGKKLAQNVENYSFGIRQDIEKDKFDGYLQFVKQEGLDLANGREEATGGTSYFVFDIPKSTYDKILEGDGFEGVRTEYFVRTTNGREYLFEDEYSHLVGFVREEVLDTNRVELVGISGVEGFYEEKLEGEEGKVINVLDLNGEAISREVEGMKEGEDIFLSINAPWQELAVRELENLVSEGQGGGGAFVVMKASTGEVYTMAGLPTYSSSEMVDDKEGSYYSRVLEDFDLSFLNPSISMRLSPGSTFKPFVAYYGLEEGVVTQSSVFVSTGCIDISEVITFCEADGVVLGSLNMSTALARSSNLYFCNIGIKLHENYGEGAALQQLLSGLDKFGFEDVTGIDLQGEAIGTLPSVERLQRLGGRAWSRGDTCNTVIGQGMVTVTPIRMAVGLSVIVNDGYMVTPRITKLGDGELVERQFVEGWDVQNSRIVMEGMTKTLTDSLGTARSLTDYEGLWVKTGSADAIEKYEDDTIREGAHSWVVGGFELAGEDYVFVLANRFGGRGFESLPFIETFMDCVDSDFGNDGCV